MYKYLAFGTLLFILFFSACESISEEELFPEEDNECNIENISYSEDIVPLLSTNCYECHGVGISNGGVTLEGYDNLQIVVENGRFLGAINREPGYSPMPQNAAKFSECILDQIGAWVAEGALNN